MKYLYLITFLFLMSSCSILEGISDEEQATIDNAPSIQKQLTQCKSDKNQVDQQLKTAIAEKNRIQSTADAKINKLREQYTIKDNANRKLTAQLRESNDKVNDVTRELTDLKTTVQALEIVFRKMDRDVVITKLSLEEDGKDQGEGWGLTTKMNENYNNEISKILGIDRYNHLQPQVKEFYLPQKRIPKRSFNKEQ